MSQHKFPGVRVQLVAPDTTELWMDFTPFLASAGITSFRGRLVLMDKQGNFSCRVAVQTFSADAEFPNVPLAPQTGFGLAAVNTQTKNVFEFDPTNANNGDTNSIVVGKTGVRVGIFYKSTGGVARGEVLLEVVAVLD